tara:strand:+ start:773565 stop:774437 length:873 start_codon:yes stop_codon:yes gene_type:complete
MNCSDVQALLAEYLLRELSPEQQAAVDLHLDQGCDQCVAVLKELDASASLVFDSIEAVAPPPELLSQVHDRIGEAGPPRSKPGDDSIETETIAESEAWSVDIASATHRHVTAQPVRQIDAGSPLSQSIPSNLLRVLFAMAGCFAGFYFVPHSSPPPAEPFESVFESSVARPDVRTVHNGSIYPPARSDQRRGQVFWDLQARQVHFVLDEAGVTQPTPDRTVWFLTDQGNWYKGGTLTLDGAGFGFGVFDFPDTKETIVSAAITLPSDVSEPPTMAASLYVTESISESRSG